MNFGALTQRPQSLFAAVGGWLTVAEAVTAQALFVVTYLLTDELVASALVAVGAMVVFAIVRTFTDRKYASAVIPLLMVGGSAWLAGTTGQEVDFYLKDIIAPVVASAVFLVSILIGWPMIGLLVGAARGERFGWRRDRTRRRRYQACTAVFLAKFGVAVAVLTPLYLGEHLVALCVANILLDTPGTALCVYVCWRILRR